MVSSKALLEKVIQERRLGHVTRMDNRVPTHP